MVSLAWRLLALTVREALPGAAEVLVVPGVRVHAAHPGARPQEGREGGLGPRHHRYSHGRAAGGAST